MNNRFFKNKQCKEDTVDVPFFEDEVCCDPDVPVSLPDCTPLDPFNLCNPGFESPNYSDNGAPGWFNSNIQCWRTYGLNTPDILPVNPTFPDLPSQGISYIGLQAGGLPLNTYMPGEIIEQTLAVPMTPNALIYFFNIDAIELTSRIWAPGFGYGVLEVWGGTNNNVPSELLWTSPVMNQGLNWITFAVSFTPTLAHRYLFFQFTRTIGTSCALGIDNMSEIQTQCVTAS